MGFSTLLDIDKLTRARPMPVYGTRFSTLLDIDKLTQVLRVFCMSTGFSTLLDIDKLTLRVVENEVRAVLVLCWILINLHL